MSMQAREFDFPAGKNAFFPSYQLVGENASDSEGTSPNPQTTFTSETDWSFTGMYKVPTNISDLIVERLSKIAHVRAVLMGKSGEVFHVWTMIDEWTLQARKSIYAAQKEMLLSLKGFDLDFYVVHLGESESPDTMVSGIPTVYQRA